MGVDRHHAARLSRLRRRPVASLFGTLFRNPQGTARCVVRDPRTHETPEVPQLPAAPVRSCFCRLSLLRAVRRCLPGRARTYEELVSRFGEKATMADKICNLTDMATSPPADWGLERRREYFDWAKSVVEQCHQCRCRLCSMTRRKRSFGVAKNPRRAVQCRPVALHEVTQPLGP